MIRVLQPSIFLEASTFRPFCSSSHFPKRICCSAASYYISGATAQSWS